VRCRFTDIALVFAVAVAEDPQHAELVALRIDHDDPALVADLADVGSAGTQRLEPSHLGIAVMRP